MTLPKPPEKTVAIPNGAFYSPEVTSIKGPYWYMPIGSGLEADGQGSIQVTGQTPSNPYYMIYGPTGDVGVGTGLTISSEGYLERP